MLNPKHESTGRLRRRYLARRLEILRAAGETFRVNGFAETGMRDIAAAAASLSPPTSTIIFKGKHEILFFCQDNSLDRMIASLDKARRLQERSCGAKKLRLVIVSHVRCVLDEVEGSAAHLLTTALPARLQRSLIAKRDRYEEGVRQLIAAGSRSGQFFPCDPALLARAVLGALNWSVRWFSPQGTLTSNEVADGFAEYLIRGLLAKPSRPRNASPGRKALRAIRNYPLRDVKRRAPAPQLSREVV